MNNKAKFEKLCRYIWQEHPHDFIAVQVNRTSGEEGQKTYFFASPDGELNGTVCISELGMMRLAKRLGYAGARIIKQRGRTGKLVIPNPDEIERDKLADY